MIKPSLLPTPYQLYASNWTSQPLDWTNPNVFKQSKPSFTWFEHFFAKKLTHCFLTKVPSEHTTAKFLDFTFQFLSPPWFFTTKFLDFTFSLFGKDSLGTFFCCEKKIRPRNNIFIMGDGLNISLVTFSNRNNSNWGWVSNRIGSFSGPTHFSIP